MTQRPTSRRSATPFALVVVAVLATDVVFAVDSVPAVHGITGHPYLVFATNAFALLGLWALYFVLEGALSKLVHLGYGLAAILGFIGTKLVLHWAHGVWPGVPEIPTLLSLGVIVGILALVTATSLYATRDDRRGEEHPEHQTGHVSHPGGIPRSLRGGRRHPVEETQQLTDAAGPRIGMEPAPTESRTAGRRGGR